jgi:O-antigen/teichoic acid export membrane protein
VLLFGDRWGPAGEVTAALGMWTVAGVLISIAAEVLKATGRTKEMLKMNSVNTTVTLATMAAMVPLGLTGAAYGLSLGTTLSACNSMRIVSRDLMVPLRAMVAEIWPPLLASLGMAFALLPVEQLLDPPAQGTFVGLLLVGGEALAGLALFALLLRILAPSRAREVSAAVIKLVNRRSGGWRKPSGSAA